MGSVIVWALTAGACAFTCLLCRMVDPSSAACTGYTYVRTQILLVQYTLGSTCNLRLERLPTPVVSEMRRLLLQPQSIRDHELFSYLSDSRSLESRLTCIAERLSLSFYPTYASLFFPQVRMIVLVLLLSSPLMPFRLYTCTSQSYVNFLSLIIC